MTTLHPGMVRRATVMSVAVLLATLAAPMVTRAQTVAEDIRREATSPNSETHHPLPLVGTWSASSEWRYAEPDGGFSPDWQLQMIMQGHHLLLGAEIPLPEHCAGSQCPDEILGYWRTALQNAATLQLPINLVGTQWEHYLSDDPAFLNLPYAQNPNVVTNGIVQRKVSPFGALQPWYDVGRKWGSSPLMQQLQTWYPSPPLVVFVSNNEWPKLLWTEAETDQHYLDLYGTGRTDDFKRRVVGDGWIARYRELQRGFRDALSAPAWKSNAKFVGFEAFGPVHYGRWGGWTTYALPTTNRIDPNPMMWDGGSPSYYLASYNGATDFTVYSPQLGSMNWVFMLDEAHRINPSFWFELSTWSGGDDLKTATAWAKLLTPERYGGMVQFGMWLTRPRVVREFPYSIDYGPSSVDEPWLTPIIAAVDQIYANSILQRFWRSGQLVPNPARPHPYRQMIPAEYANAERMFLLTTNLDPPQPWTNSTNDPLLNLQLPVFALARSLGQAPTREWLVYIHSPLQDRATVQVTIPGYKDVQVMAPVAGAFYWVKETDNTVSLITGTTVSPAPPSSFEVD